MNLREVREKSNLKVKGMCNLLGTYRTRYFQLEKGTERLTAEERKILNEFVGSELYARISKFRTRS